MKRTGKVKWGNLKVGIVVTFAIAVVLYASFSGGGVPFFAPRDYLVSYFDNVNGLVKGASVRMSGVEVGNVKSVKFVNLDAWRRLEVKMSIVESVWGLITTDSRAQLGTIGLLGDKYVEILPGTPGLPLLKSGDELPVIPEVGLEPLVRRPPEVNTSIDSIVYNLKDISRKIATGEGTAGRIISDTTLYANLASALEQTTRVMSEIQKNQKRIMDKLDATLERTSSITSKMDRGEGNLGKFINEEGLYNSLSSSTGRLDSILAKIDRGEGSAGALVNDAQLYEKIRNLVVRVNNLVTDIEQNPRKYFKFSVF
jgi:phospholipid/cholesterol/gamma-HCH transport system substrate-binding protein